MISNVGLFGKIFLVKFDTPPAPSEEAIIGTVIAIGDEVSYMFADYYNRQVILDGRTLMEFPEDYYIELMGDDQPPWGDNQEGLTMAPENVHECSYAIIPESGLMGVLLSD